MAQNRRLNTSDAPSPRNVTNAVVWGSRPGPPDRFSAVTMAPVTATRPPTAIKMSAVASNAWTLPTTARAFPGQPLSAHWARSDRYVASLLDQTPAPTPTSNKPPPTATRPPTLSRVGARVTG